MPVCRPGAVLWDADGVLQAAAPGWRERLVGIGGEDFLQDLFDAEKPCLRGESRFEDAVARVLARHGIQTSAGDVMASWAEIVVDTAALSLVDEVRGRGVRCYLATNQQDYRRDVMRARLPYAEHFDGEFYSCDLGVAKPEARYFTAVLDAVELPVGQVLFIDDSGRNVNAARAVGLQAVLHDPIAGASGLAAILRRYDLI
ncbi:HAD family hydrolase [Leekyejoonella antrihumi]|uniref:HAD family hydrolase n=1 Tax=Leekyejoonella antrihumi TaxID=1660198 RepID=A0A563DXD0_9MICO|nr:HAD-IA family hydrolase [Leekyejoonella antrihumi]TWP34876.1 HAD family hydrolase [Leekyejoonella antrihumi]